MARKKAAGKKRAPAKKANPGVTALKRFSPRIFGRWARAAVLAVAEKELTGAGKKQAASDHVAGLVADAIPDTPTGTLIEMFAVPVARALLERAIQKAYDELKAAGQVQ